MTEIINYSYQVWKYTVFNLKPDQSFVRSDYPDYAHFVKLCFAPLVTSVVLLRYFQGTIKRDRSMDV